MRRLLSVGLMLAALVVPVTPAHAQANPFEAVTAIVNWFDGLNQSWNRVVTREERAQYLRSLDRLRGELIDLQGGTQLLLATIPDAEPDDQERMLLQEQADELSAILERVRDETRNVQVEMSLTDPQLPGRIGQTGAARGAAISFLRSELLETGPTWRSPEIKARLSSALALLSRTQIAVTQFRNRIAAQR